MVLVQHFLYRIQPKCYCFGQNNGNLWQVEICQNDTISAQKTATIVMKQYNFSTFYIQMCQNDIILAKTLVKNRNLPKLLILFQSQKMETTVTNRNLLKQ